MSELAWQIPTTWPSPGAQADFVDGAHMPASADVVGLCTQQTSYCPAAASLAKAAGRCAAAGLAAAAAPGAGLQAAAAAARAAPGECCRMLSAVKQLAADLREPALQGCLAVAMCTMSSECTCLIFAAGKGAESRGA